MIDKGRVQELGGALEQFRRSFVLALSQFSMRPPGT